MPRRDREERERELRQALDERPAWVRAIWRTPARRLAVSLVFLAIGALILLATVTGEGGVIAFLFAPLLIVLFALQAGEAIRDMVRGTDSLPIFHRAGAALDRRWPLVLAYLAVMVVVYVLVS